ncbi:DUF16 domain-containing protein [Mycoplasmoides pneumoniae]|uniref:DUF16 domain-containing protein n=1 Tax=Mycoplasmoides pneumoniae TaxID=2104 RepID=UPI00071B1186|nr:DUF16 domain-containing protein [Mycoplasmoides pneumoniae]QHR14780.1 DUF16 domain-containing protein [Mycoplasmoides pneumoniae]
MAYSPSLNDIKSILNKYTSKDYELKCENRYDGKLELWLKGIFEEIVKTPGTRYVTHKQLDEKLKNFVTKTEFKEFQTVVMESFAVQNQNIDAQGEQIKELQVEQKAQGKTLQLILEALQGINKRLDNLESK